MGNTAELSILLKLKDEASQGLKNAGDATGGLSSKMLALGAALATAAAGYVSFQSIKGAIESTQQLGDSITEMTRLTGLSAEKSSDYIYAAKMMGLSADDLGRNFGILEKRLTGVLDGTEGLAASTGPVAPILADMGINALDAAGNIRPMADLIPEIADAFAGMTDPVQRAGRANELFGRSGVDMLPFLTLGSKGLEEMSAEARKLGLELSAGNVAKIHEYTLAQRKFGEALGGVKLVIGLAVLPILTRFMDLLISLQPVIRDKLGGAIQWLTTVFGSLAAYIKYAVTTGDSLNEYLTGARTPLSTFFLLLGETVLSLKDIGEWLLTAADAVYKWGRNIADMLDDGRDMADNFGALNDIVPLVADAIAVLVAAMVVGTVATFVGAIADLAVGIVTFPIELLKDVVGVVADLVSTAAQMVSKAITITQNVIRTGVDVIQFLVDVTGTVFQNVVRTGAKIIDVLNPVTGTVTQNIQLQTPAGAGEGTKGWFANLMGNILGGLGGSPEVLRGISKFIGLLGAAIGGGIVVAISGGITAAGVGTALVAAIALPIGVAFATYLAIIAELPVILTVALIRHFGGAIKLFFGQTLPRLFTEGIPQFAKSLPGWAGFLAGAVAGAIIFALFGIPALLITRVAPALADAIGGIFKGISWDKIGETFAGLGGRIAGWITGGLATVGAAFSAIPGLLSDALKSIPGLLAEVGRGIQDFAASVPGWIAEAFVSIPGLVVDISTAFLDFATNLPGWISAAFGAIPGIITGFLSGAGGAVELVAGAMASIFQAVLTTPLGDAAGYIMGQFAAGFAAGWSAVNDMTGGSLADLTNALGGFTTTMWTLGSNAVGAFWEGLTAAFGWPFDWGQRIVNGLWEGIQSLKDWIVGQAEDFGRSIYNAIKDGLADLWPFSPSKAGVKIGSGLILGIGKGIAESLSALSSPMTGLSRAMVVSGAYSGGSGGRSTPVNQSTIGHQGMNNYGRIDVHVQGGGGDFLAELERQLR